MVGTYPLRVDFRDLSRWKFDYICSSLRPDQVIALCFCEVQIPDQVIVFQRYFPRFQLEFLHLRRLECIRTDYILSSTPSSITTLTYQSRNRVGLTGYQMIKTITKQASSLTYLKIDSFSVIESINTPLPLLTHLYIVGDTCYGLQFQPSLIDVNDLIQNLRSPITHLEIIIPNSNLLTRYTTLNLNCLAPYLKHLKLFNNTDDYPLSMDALQRLLIPLFNLKRLTLDLVCLLDVFDGNKWKEFLLQTSINRFQFQFSLSIRSHFNHHESLLLDSFRSTFWLEEKHCYVAYYECPYENSIKRRIIYSIPGFQSRSIRYMIDSYPPLSTVPSNYEELIFYSKHICSLSLNFNRSILKPMYPFAHVGELELTDYSLPSIEVLTSFANLNRIRILDLSQVKTIFIGHIYSLLQSMPRLNHLILEHFIPLFLPPAHIHSFTINQWRSSDDFEIFCRMFAHVKSIDIAIKSHEMIFILIKRLKHLQHGIFRYNFEKYPTDTILQSLKRSIWHMIGKNITYQEDDYYVVIAIGKKQRRNHE